MSCKRGQGFTLIELVMVIVILGILSAVAIPMYLDYQTEAVQAGEKGVVGGVRAGILTYYMQKDSNGRPTKAYPAALDNVSASTACASGSACFTNVLQQGGITSDWTKATATTYTGPTGTTYTYTAATGSFL